MDEKTGLIAGPDGVDRCAWHGNLPDYLHYHDNEWGRPVADDRRLFEKICLEGFQSGLSWLTILRKRENFREAFDGFDFDRVAKFTEADIERLLTNAGIIRHRGKIEAAIHNARCAQRMRASEGSLASFLWRYEPKAAKPAGAELASTSPESVALSKDLKKLGWKFVGPTTVYAFMQAMGLVNDHLEGCVCRQKVEAERKAFRRPSP